MTLVQNACVVLEAMFLISRKPNSAFTRKRSTRADCLHIPALYGSLHEHIQIHIYFSRKEKNHITNLCNGASLLLKKPRQSSAQSRQLRGEWLAGSHVSGDGKQQRKHLRSSCAELWERVDQRHQTLCKTQTGLRRSCRPHTTHNLACCCTDTCA
jgi:hypothetical protein